MVIKKVSLPFRERQALQEFVAYLRKRLSNQVEFVALFGSKARGDSGPDSDVDVLVVLSREDREIRREILIAAARLSLEYDVLLSPRVIGAERWEKMRDFSLYRNVQRESVSLGLADGKLMLETPRESL